MNIFYIYISQSSAHLHNQSSQFTRDGKERGAADSKVAPISFASPQSPS
jgi:hypothetical protein